MCLSESSITSRSPTLVYPRFWSTTLIPSPSSQERWLSSGWPSRSSWSTATPTRLMFGLLESRAGRLSHSARVLIKECLLIASIDSWRTETVSRNLRTALLIFTKNFSVVGWQIRNLVQTLVRCIRDSRSSAKFRSCSWRTRMWWASQMSLLKHSSKQTISMRSLMETLMHRIISTRQVCPAPQLQQLR